MPQSILKLKKCAGIFFEILLGFSFENCSVFIHAAPTPIHRGAGWTIGGYKVGAKVRGVWHISKRFLHIFLHGSYIVNLTWILH